MFQKTDKLHHIALTKVSNNNKSLSAIFQNKVAVFEFQL